MGRANKTELTCTPPAPTTYNSCVRNNDASKFIRVVPATLLRSENKLQQKSKIISFFD